MISTLYGYRTEILAIDVSSLFDLESSEETSEFLLFLGLMGKIAIRAGRKITVNTNASITPTEANLPKFAIGSTPAVEKDKSPPAVVTLVINTARPECPRA